MEILQAKVEETYRHKETGIELMKDVNEGEIYSNLAKKLENGIKGYTEFITDSNNDWDLIGKVNMKFNRMVIYPINLFHSGYIKKHWFLNSDRITQTAFY